MENTEVKEQDTPKDLQDEEDLQTGMKAVRMITAACNYGAGKKVAEGMIHALQHEHRTLQQDFWRTMRIVIDKYADFSHDLRNEGAVEMCEKIKKIDHCLPRY